MTYFNSSPSARGDAPAVADGEGQNISIHAPPRGATCQRPKLLTLPKGFQFTPLREGRRVQPVGMCPRQDFNSRPSARGDDADDATLPTTLVFQFTPLREGRLAPLHYGRRRQLLFQFTPLREGRLEADVQDAYTKAISIHAPPRGATRRRTSNSRLTDFNSRPSARGDFPTVGITITCHYFNSRPSARGDLHPCEHSPSPCISIHAPPRGATDNGK